MDGIALFGLSDVGMVRDENEDSFLCTTIKGIAVLLVADGMGGHVGGKVASGLAVQTIGQYIKTNAMRLPPATLVSDSMTLTHRHILDRRDIDPSLKGMGTTCTLALVIPDEEALSRQKAWVFMGHIGDSKLYRIAADGIYQQSTDHTMVQRLLDSGALSNEEAQNYPYKNVIYKSLGGSDHLALDQPQSFCISPGEALLLCSDGLSGYLSAEEMHNILLASDKLEAAADYMVNLAKFRGGDDNISVVLAAFGPKPQDKSRKLDVLPRVQRPGIRAQGPSTRGRWLGALMILLVGLISILFFLILVPGNGKPSKPAINNIQAPPSQGPGQKGGGLDSPQIIPAEKKELKEFVHV
jgi:protein phosphatase